MSKGKELFNFVVLYRIESIMSPLDEPFGFQCWAEDADHAEKQCLNAYPDCNVVWVWAGLEELGMVPALQDYWSIDHHPTTQAQSCASVK